MPIDFKANNTAIEFFECRKEGTFMTYWGNESIYIAKKP
jgi:hypothetical protein